MSNPAVIFIPGLGGSTLRQINPTFPDRDIWYNALELAIVGPDNLQLAPNGIDPGPLAGNPLQPRGLVNQGIYEPMVSQLQNDGWDVGVFSFDWRKSILVTGAQLSVLLQLLFPDRAFWVVAHSLGGLVARVAFHNLAGTGTAFNWQRTVYLGTPQGGAYDSAMMLSGWQPSGSWLYSLWSAAGLGLRPLLDPAAKPSSVSDRLKQVVASWPSLYECLPSQQGSYAGVDPLGPDLFQQATYAPTNPYVSQAHLDAATGVQVLLNGYLSQTRPPEVEVAGGSKQTNARVKDLNKLASYAGYTQFSDGDGVVLLERSSLPSVNLDRLVADHYAVVNGQPLLSQITGLLKNGLAVPESEPSKVPGARVALPPQQAPLTTIVFPFPALETKGDP